MYTLLSPDKTVCVGVFTSLEEAREWRANTPRYALWQTLELLLQE